MNVLDKYELVRKDASEILEKDVVELLLGENGVSIFCNIRYIKKWCNIINLEEELQKYIPEEMTLDKYLSGVAEFVLYTKYQGTTALSNLSNWFVIEFGVQQKDG